MSNTLITITILYEMINYTKLILFLFLKCCCFCFIIIVGCKAFYTSHIKNGVIIHCVALNQWNMYNIGKVVCIYLLNSWYVLILNDSTTVLLWHTYKSIELPAQCEGFDSCWMLTFIYVSSEVSISEENGGCITFPWMAENIN